MVQGRRRPDSQLRFLSRVMLPQALLTGAFSGGDAGLHGRLVAAFRSNVHWQQYSQCHWATARACGNVTCAEKEGRG